MSNTFNEELERLLAEPQRIIAERTALSESIQKAESDLLIAGDELASAQRRKAQEEYDAAQSDGRAAIASPETCITVTKAELDVKTRKLRLDGLRSRIAPLDSALLQTRAPIEACVSSHLQGLKSNLSAELDLAMRRFIDLIQQGIILYEHTLRMPPGKWKFNSLSELRVFNPMKSLAQSFTHDPSNAGNSGLYDGRLFDGGIKGFVHGTAWDHSAEARKLDVALKALEDRIGQA